MPDERNATFASVTVSASGDDVSAERRESPANGESAMDAARLTRGAVLARYLILDELGQGASGIVYSAFDPDLDRKVALKILRGNPQGQGRARLLREAQAMAKLSHPHVVTVYEVGTDAGCDYVSMECVDGQNLSAWQDGPHDADEVLAVYRQAGLGLAAAHRAGLVHRDFKPHNVLIDVEGRVLVTDFGLAREFQSASDGQEDAAAAQHEFEDVGPHLTRTGALLGTPAYMAPEQHRRQAADARSDQYAFCVALYEALSGQRPCAATEYEQLRTQVLEDKAPALPESVAVRASLRAAIARGLERDPLRRHASMDALLSELQPAPRARWPLMLGVAVGALALLIVGLTMGSEAAADRCQADPSVLAGSWDEQVRTQVGRAFRATGVEEADEVFGKFAGLANDYAGELVALRLQICRSSRSQKAPDDSLMLMQMTCLQKRRQELQALTSAFSNVDARGVDRALEATLALTPVRECQDTAALLRGVKGPPAQARDQVLALQAKLQEAKSEGEAGHSKSAIVRAEAARDSSLQLGYLPLQAEAQALLGHLYFDELRITDSERAYDEAILAAEESGYTEYRARALVGMTLLVADGSSRYHEARRLARRARAAISQWGGNTELSVDVDLAMAVILQHEGRLKEALALLEATWRSVHGTDKTTALQIARLQDRIGEIKAETGKYVEAQQLASSSYELVRAELGDNNPKTIEYLNTVAIILRMRGNNEEAQKVDKRLRRYWASDKARAQLVEDDDYTEGTREVSGQVLGPEGIAIDGATVLCNKRVFADSRHLDVAWNARSDALHHYQRVISDDDGRFTCKAASTKALLVIADHPSVGRSAPWELSASSEPSLDVTLTLMPTGFLSGVVVKDGQPAQAQAVTAVPMQERVVQPRFAALTFLRSDGSYSFERLAPGRYKVFSGASDGTASALVHTSDVDIESGAGATLDIDQSEGDAGLSVVVKGLGGVPIPSAQVLLVPGHFESQTASQFNAMVLGATADVRSYFWSAGETLAIDDLKPGLHSLCVAALGGDFRDPEYIKQFDKDVLDSLPVHCRDVEVQSGKLLAVEVEVAGFRFQPKVKAPRSAKPATE